MAKEKKNPAEQKPQEKEMERYLVMSDGTEYKVTGEDGKYYQCAEDGTRFRKLNPQIVSVLCREKRTGEKAGRIPEKE